MNFEKLRKELLEAHNNYRTYHSVPVFKYSKDLEISAQSWAINLSKWLILAYSPENKIYSENVAEIRNPIHVKGSQIVDTWYSQEKYCDYEKFLHTGAIDQFSVVIWKASINIGFGLAVSDDNRLFVVTHYSPPGLNKNTFKDNVLPPINYKTIERIKTYRIAESVGSECKLIKQAEMITFQEDTLKKINDFRLQHGGKPLTLSEKLNESAIEEAIQSATKHTLVSLQNIKVGHTYLEILKPDFLITGGMAPRQWYTEIYGYDFTQEPETDKSNNFTQMIWMETTECGIGAAASNEGVLYIIGNFFPIGNRKGKYLENVKPSKEKHIYCLCGCGYVAPTCILDLSATVLAKHPKYPTHDTTDEIDFYTNRTLTVLTADRIGNDVKLFQVDSVDVSVRREASQQDYDIDNVGLKTKFQLFTFLNFLMNITKQKEANSVGDKLDYALENEKLEKIKSVSKTNKTTSKNNALSKKEFSREYEMAQSKVSAVPSKMSQSKMSVNPSNISQKNSVIQSHVSQAKSDVPSHISQAKSNVQSNISQAKSDVQSHISQAKSNVPSHISQVKSDVQPKMSQVSRQTQKLVLNVNKIKEELLQSHNNYREIHDEPPLQLDPELEASAQAWAETLSIALVLTYSPPNPYRSENCAEIRNTSTLKGNDVTDLWYSQIKNYDFEMLNHTGPVDQFSIMMWKSTNKVGFGVGLSSDNRIFVVAHYTPPGVSSESVKENIKPTKDYVKPSTAIAPFVPIDATLKSYKGIKREELHEFWEDAIGKLNHFRLLHGSPALKLNDNLCKAALDQAKRCATNHMLLTTNSKEFGETYLELTIENFTITGGLASRHWYAESVGYNYDAEPESDQYHNFAQLVWKSSMEMGIGVAASLDGVLYIIGHFLPPGNVANQYVNNVRPPKEDNKFCPCGCGYVAPTCVKDLTTKIISKLPSMLQTEKSKNSRFGTSVRSYSIIEDLKVPTPQMNSKMSKGASAKLSQVPKESTPGDPLPRSEIKSQKSREVQSNLPSASIRSTIDNTKLQEIQKSKENISVQKPSVSQISAVTKSIAESNKPSQKISQVGTARNTQQSMTLKEDLNVIEAKGSTENINIKESKISQAPSKVSQTPSKVSQPQSKVSQTQSKVSQGPSRVSQTPVAEKSIHGQGSKDTEGTLQNKNTLPSIKSKDSKSKEQ